MCEQKPTRANNPRNEKVKERSRVQSKESVVDFKDSKKLERRWLGYKKVGVRSARKSV